VQYLSPNVDSLGVPIKGWQWNFGDGSYGIGENPVHYYTNVGSYYPMLTVTNTMGVTASNTGPIITVTNPVMAYTASPTNTCRNYTVQFRAPNLDSGGNLITNWQWNFGDGTFGSGENPTHQYTNDGTFTPVLISSNWCGLSPTTYGPAVTVSEPTIKYSSYQSNGVSRLTVQYLSPNVDSLGVPIKGWQWSFGDGTYGIGEYPVHIYTNVGSYYPVLTVTNTVGVTATSSSLPITVTNPIVKYVVTPTNGSLPLTVRFSAPGVDSGGNAITNWQWNFGDGTFGTGPAPVHVYTNNGAYYLVLTTSNMCGLSPTSVGPAEVIAGNPSLSSDVSLPTFVITAAPQLSIASGNGFVILSWSTNATGYLPQSATNILPPINWMNVTSPPVVISGQNVLTNDTSAPQMFFRLSK
jgi:PKD repeat protein